MNSFNWLLIVACICTFAFYMQRAHYDFKRETREWKDNTALSAELEQGLKELKDMKADVSGLKMRLGVKGL